MKLQVNRETFTPNSCIGSLFIDGVQFCNTLERPLQEYGGQAPFAIPPGTYPILMQESAHFNTITPHLQDVPGRTFIEIHWGNYPKDTEGCLLVGEYDSNVSDFVGHSRDEFQQFMSRLMTSTDGWEITIG